MSCAGLIVAGLSHRTASVDLIGACALDTLGADSALRGRAGIQEVVPLSTCNRREIYALARDPGAAGEAIAQALADASRRRRAELSPFLTIHRDEGVAKHLFRVASSLDSMVLGESEIQGQVRRAWESARARGAGGHGLDRLFRRALQVGRRVRRETTIGAGRVSVPSVAVGLAERAVGPLADRRVVVVGAGQMAGVVADALATRRVREVVIVSRRAESAAAVAAVRGWRSANLAALGSEIRLADVVITATAAPHALITRGDVERAMSTRSQAPLALIDMAVPCDIEPAAVAVPGVTLHTMEDIRGLAAAGSRERLAQAALAEEIVVSEVERFARVRPERGAPTPVAAW
jgi:glutamyl-tRNA reductase